MGQIISFIIVAVIAAIWYLINKYSKKYWYIYQGKSKCSFLYHGIALCYEQLEIGDTEGENSIPKIEDYARWNIDNKGHGILQTQDYVLRSNIKGGTDIIIQAVSIDAMYSDFANELYSELVAKNEGFLYNLEQNASGTIFLTIGQEINGDPKESDARYYISGAYEDILCQKRTEIQRKYNKYKQDHPYTIQ